MKLLKSAALLSCVLAVSCTSAPKPSDAFSRAFEAPSQKAKPWVYWYFMDGHITREGLSADLETMKRAGIGGAIFLTVDIGVPRGPVAFMSAEWQDLFAFAMKEANRLGIEISLGTGPGWAGSGGPWVAPDDSMQHLVGTLTEVKGGDRVEVALPKPSPREPFFGRGPMSPEMLETWKTFYRDVAVVAYLKPAPGPTVPLIDEKALYYRAPYSSSPNVRAFLEMPAVPATIAPNQCLDRGTMIDLTDKLDANGMLHWDAPHGEWIVYRMGRTLTGQTTRPSPLAGLGFESDKFSREAVNRHLHSFLDPLISKVGADRADGRGLALLHFDSWEMGSQNFSPVFRDEFKRRRGYDPLPFLPAYLGHYVTDARTTERFLWDVRRTASELVYDNHATPLHDYATKHGLKMSGEMYDMNPSGDLKLGAFADVPMGEFWSWDFGFSTEFSVIEAVSVAHTNGRSVVGAEAFTAQGGEDWQLYPARMKAQTDWALAAGINRFVFHRFQHQPTLTDLPGMRMGPYGVEWDRTQTFWPMVDSYHAYLSRCSEILRTGLPVADVLYLAPEGTPHVFRAPASATRGPHQDRRGYNFDGIDPDTLIAHASVKDGAIVFPDGMSYRLLVLPRMDTMTPALLRKVKTLVEAGATVVGARPIASPSLSDASRADAEVNALASELWGDGTLAERRVGKGRLVNDAYSAAMPEPADAIKDARWIGYDDGTPGADASPCTQYFQRTFDLTSTPQRAMLWVNVDNSGDVFVNDQPVGSVVYYKSGWIDVKAALRPGRNIIRVAATNGGNAPNPMGVIGVLRMVGNDGVVQSIATDAEWTAAPSADGVQKPVKLIANVPGGWRDVKPVQGDRELYAPYDVTAEVLKSVGVVPDFESSVDLRYTHRRAGDVDLYFVANPADQSVEATATFRVSGRSAQWWNPVTGERRPIACDVGDNGTRVALSLGPTESGFVVFGTTETAPAAVPTTSTQPIAGPWNVRFDSQRGGPDDVAMPTLSDWSKSDIDGVKFYSGEAVYRTSFDSPKTSAGTLSLGDVRVMARVTLNGRDLGIVWCPPWEVRVPAGVLRASGNELQVRVANLWINRLIGDSALPEEKRFTRTTHNPFKPASTLQPSGLLGPVTLRLE